MNRSVRPAKVLGSPHHSPDHLIRQIGEQLREARCERIAVLGHDVAIAVGMSEQDDEGFSGIRAHSPVVAVARSTQGLF